MCKRKNNCEESPHKIRDGVKDIGEDARLVTYLRRQSQSLPKPVVLFIDEIDALVGDSLVSVLRQLRAGYANRPRETTWKMEENRDRSVTITPEMIYRAQERIIYRRDTHIDILIYKLQEERVKRVIEPILANAEEPDESIVKPDDIQYVTDMGLITRDRGKPIRIANGIYREIIPRELTWNTQQTLIQEPQWYQNADGSINMEKLLLDFQQFFFLVEVPLSAVPKFFPLKLLKIAFSRHICT